MKGLDASLVVVREWLAKAENDLLNASYTLGLGRRCPTDSDTCSYSTPSSENHGKPRLCTAETTAT